MSLNFEVLDFLPTPIGDLMLRRRRMPQFGELDIFEVKLAEDFLMTSLFHEAESQLAYKGLATVEKTEKLDVVVGGLGLGYTAHAALEDSRVSSLLVIDYLEAVIGWHEKHMVPVAKELIDDPRCRLHHADFFALAADPETGFDPDQPSKRYDAILLDIDHTPENLLDPGNAGLYNVEGLTVLRQHLAGDGVFAMWADGAPEEAFTARLNEVFSHAVGHTIEFDNPITDSTSVGAVYVAKH